MGHETINLRTTVLDGHVDLFVARCTLSSVYQCAATQLPNTSYYVRSTVAMGSASSLSVTRNDPTYVRYLVGVLSYSRFASFVTSASFQDTVLELQAGIAVTDSVGHGQEDHFSFFLDQEDQLVRFSLTTVSDAGTIEISRPVVTGQVMLDIWGPRHIHIDNGGASVFLQLHVALYSVRLGLDRDRPEERLEGLCALPLLHHRVWRLRVLAPRCAGVDHPEALGWRHALGPRGLLQVEPLRVR